MLGALVEEVRRQTEDNDCKDELRSAQNDGKEAREDHRDGCWTWSRRSGSGWDDSCRVFGRLEEMMV